MTKLITLSDIQEFKGISSNITTAKNLDPFILEAQEFDLRQFMGESFYIALLDDFESSPSLDFYGDLFNGLRYTHNGNQYEHKGLKSVLIYHAYARYLAGAQMQSTPTGIVQKVNQYSEPVSDAALGRMIKQARSGAEAHADRVRDYLDRKSSEFPLWKCGTKRRFKSGMKIKSIG